MNIILISEPYPQVETESFEKDVQKKIFTKASCMYLFYVLIYLQYLICKLAFVDSLFKTFCFCYKLRSCWLVRNFLKIFHKTNTNYF